MKRYTFTGLIILYAILALLIVGAGVRGHLSLQQIDAARAASAAAYPLPSLVHVPTDEGRALLQASIQSTIDSAKVAGMMEGHLRQQVSQGWLGLALLTLLLLLWSDRRYVPR